MEKINNTNTKSRFHPNGDIWGFSGGVLCLLHCIALPLAGIIPALGGTFFAHLHIHALDYLFIAIALFAVVFSYGSTPVGRSRYLLLAGFVLFASGTVLHDVHSWMLLPAIVGSLMLVWAHGGNLVRRWQGRSCSTTTTSQLDTNKTV